jgi:type VI secretion system secreted protein VgrG
MPVVRQPDGSIKVGNGLIIKGDPAYQAKVLADLQTIAGTPTGTKLLSDIDKSGKTVTIQKTTGGNSENADNFNDGLRKADGTPGPGSNSTVDFNPDKTQIGDGSEPWMTRPTAVGLGHELIHAAHDANGTTEYDSSNPGKSPQNYETQDVGLKDTKNGAPVDYSGNDYTENKLRKDLGQPERPRY